MDFCIECPHTQREIHQHHGKIVNISTDIGTESKARIWRLNICRRSPCGFSSLCWHQVG